MGNNNKQLQAILISGKHLNKEQKQAMATIFNSIGLWSGQWARYLIEASQFDEPYEPTVTATVEE